MMRSATNDEENDDQTIPTSAEVNDDPMEGEASKDVSNGKGMISKERL